MELFKFGEWSFMSKSEEEEEEGKRGVDAGRGFQQQDLTTSLPPSVIAPLVWKNAPLFIRSLGSSLPRSLACSLSGNVHVSPRSRGNKGSGGGVFLSFFTFFPLPSAVLLVLTLWTRTSSVGCCPHCPNCFFVGVLAERKSGFVGPPAGSGGELRGQQSPRLGSTLWNHWGTIGNVLSTLGPKECGKDGIQNVSSFKFAQCQSELREKQEVGSSENKETSRHSEEISVVGLFYSPTCCQSLQFLLNCLSVCQSVCPPRAQKEAPGLHREIRTWEQIRPWENWTRSAWQSTPLFPSIYFH